MIDSHKKTAQIYREAFDEAISKVPVFAEYNSNEREKRRQQYIDGVRKETTEKFQHLSGFTGKEASELKAKWMNILYPSAAAERQMANALAALQTNDENLILKWLGDAIESGRNTFAATLVDKLLPQIPSHPGLRAQFEIEKPTRYAFLIQVENFQKKILEKTGLDKLEAEISEYSQLQTRVNKYIQAVESGSPFIFYEKEEVERMTRADVQANLEKVNKSAAQ